MKRGSVKLNRAQRKVIGRTLLYGFSVLEGVKHMLHYDPSLYGQVWTPKEKEYVEKLQKRLDDDAEAMRKLAWRLIRDRP